MLQAGLATARAQFAVNSPATDWVRVPYRASAVLDVAGDQASGSGESDIVGSATLGSFFTKLVPGTSATNGTLYFRIRVGGDQNPQGHKGGALVGIDANQDGRLDLFVGVLDSAKSRVAIWRPGNTQNISPYTTSVDTKRPVKSYPETSGTNYQWAAVTAASNTAGVSLDPAADTAAKQNLNSATGTDYFLSFSIPFADLVAAFGSQGITYNANSPVIYVMGTAGQAKSFDQDLNGVTGSLTSAITWTSLGVATQPLLADGTVVNSAPVNTVPGTLTANGSLALAGVSVADVNGNLASVQITASHGTVSASLSGGAAILAGANATATFTLGGTQAQINSALGTLGYTPTSGYNGAASVTIFSKDSSDESDSDTIAITVITSTNTPPVATNDTAATHSGKAVTAYVISNDTDADGNVLTITAATLTTGQGTISFANDNVTYTPPTTFTGTATIPYTISDGSGGTASATLTVNVAPNSMPVAVDDPVNANPGSTLLVDVLANDSDADGDPLTITSATRISGSGTVSVVSNMVQFDAPSANGTTTISYNISDGSGGTASATLTIITFVNTVPVAQNDTAATTSGVAVLLDVLANDSDADGDSLTITDTTLASGEGTVLAINGRVQYTPPAGFTGTATISYTIDDDRLGVASAIATVTVTNSGPVAVNDNYNVNEDEVLVMNAPGVLANDSDVDGDTPSAALVDGPAHGTLTLNANGSFTYAPAADFSGSDSFTYSAADGIGTSNPATVSITVNSVNDAPVAANDSATTLEDTVVTIPVLTNDSDVDGDALSAALASSPAHGTLTLNANGSFTYTPTGNFSGSDSFTYRASDGTVVSNLATVSLTVNSVNDAPVAANDSATTLEDTVVTIPVLTNDSDVDGDALSAALVGGPDHGTLTLNANGSFTYTPAANFNGNDTFVYRASDGIDLSNLATVSITVNSVNDAPVVANDNYSVNEDAVLVVNAPGVLANDSDVDGDTLSAALASGPVHGTLTLNANGSFTYTPAANFNGNDTFTYRASDGTVLSSLATVSITVDSVNDAPVAANDSHSMNENQTLTIPASAGVLANDSDVDGDTLSAILASGPAHGTLTLNANGSFTYTPAADFTGSDAFTYHASDGTAPSSLATVSIAVNPANNAPVAVNDDATTLEDTAVTIPVLANDSGVDGATLSISAASVNTPGAGSVVVNANGTLTFTPAPNFNGTIALNYTVRDSNAETASAFVTVAITPVNDAPVATNDSYSVNEDQTLTIPAGAGVLANDTDVDVDTLSAALASVPAHGTLTLNPNGSFTYTPTANFDGSDFFTYRAADGVETSNFATVSITVNSVNHVPVAMNDSIATNGNTAVTIDVLANDTDPDGDALTVSAITTAPTNGTASIVSDKAVYTPATGFTGTDNFAVRISDGNGGSATSTVTVMVNNRPPVALDDSATTSAGTPVNIAVLANDSDPDSHSLTVASVSAPASGTAAIMADGQITYTPPASDFAGSSFTYVVSDGHGGSATATVRVAVGATTSNALPIARDDIYTSEEVGPATIAVLANDSDPDGDTLSVSSVTQGTTGSVILNADGTVTYTPGSSFSRLDKFTVTIGDGHGGSATSHVAILMSPFVNGGSIYDGLLENPAPTGPNSGYVTVHVTRPGAFTAQIFSAGHLARFRGAFDAASNFKTSIRRRDGVQIAVALHFDLPNNRFTGTVSDGTNISAILATAFPWSKLFPTPRFGRYTMLIQADEAAGVPSSFGCATAQVLKRGLVRIIGRTADGIPFVSQTWLDANGDSFEIYAGLSNVKARGRIFGRVSFEDVPGVSDIAGTLIWDKPKRPSSLSSKGQYYTDGFTVAATCLGSTYSAPSGSRVLPLADALPNAMLALSGADFAPQLAAPLALSPHNVATVVGANPQGVTLAIKRTTGAFTGRGSLPGGTPRKFIFGVIFQKQKVGAGFFRGTAETGTVTISAP